MITLVLEQTLTHCNAVEVGVPVIVIVVPSINAVPVPALIFAKVRTIAVDWATLVMAIVLTSTGKLGSVVKPNDVHISLAATAPPAVAVVTVAVPTGKEPFSWLAIASASLIESSEGGNVDSLLFTT